MPTLKLFWESVPNAVSYTVFWGTSPGVTILTGVPISGITNVVFHHFDLLENTTYYYIVAAVDGAGTIGPASMEFSAQTSVVSSLSITPNDANIGVGISQAYTALVTYSDGYSQNVTLATTWDTDNHAFATIDASGLLTAVAVGTANVQGSYLTVNASVPVIVSHTLLFLVVTPTNLTLPALATQQYTAIGHYNDLTTSDLTSSVTWMSSDVDAATIDSAGFATLVGGGLTTITATLGLISDSTSLTVTPVLQHLALSATVFTNLTSSISDVDVTLTSNSVSGFTSSGILLIDGEQIFYTGISGNTFTGLTRGYGGTTAVSHSANSVVSQYVGTIPIVYPNTAQMTATGNYTDDSTNDVTNSVSWSSDTPSVATIDSAGLITTHHHGAAVVMATIGTIYGSVSASINVVVTNVLASIALTPPTVTLFYVGNTTQLTATGTYNDGDTANITGSVTWHTSNAGIVTIPGGLATAAGVGSANLTATSGIITSNIVPATVPNWDIPSVPGGGDIMISVVGMDDGQIVAGGSKSGGGPSIWRWDGITWSSTVSGTVFSDNNGVRSVKVSTDGYFFANTNHNIARSPDGVVWTQVTDPTPGGFAPAFCVVDSSTIWAWSGIFGTNYFKRSTDGGVTWVQIQVQSSESIEDMFCLNANSIYAFGSGAGGTYGAIWHWNGSTWTKLTTSWTSTSTAPMQTVKTMWGTSDNDLYAGGIVGSSTIPNAMIYSTNQFSSYTAQTFGTSVTTISNIDGYDGNIIYAAASSISNFTVFKHQIGYDSANTFVNAGAAFGTGQRAQGVWINPATQRVVAVGDQTAEQFGVYTATLASISIAPTVSNGHTFQPFVATGTFSNGDIRNVSNSVTWHSSTGAATISASGLATAVSDNGTSNITATYSALTSNTAIFNTKIWITQSSGTANNLTGVWGFSPTNIYAVGASGTILNWNGSSWSAQTSGTAANFLGVQGPDSGHVYAWADDSTLHVSHDGSTWTSLGTPFSFTPHGLFATTSSDMWITFNGSRFRYSSNDGVSFGLDQGNFGDGTTSLFGLSPTDMFVTQGSSQIRRWTGGAHDGTAWTLLSPNNILGGMDIFAMWGTSDSDMFIVGSFFNGASVYHTTDLFTTYTGLGPNNGALPSSNITTVNAVFGGSGFVYASNVTNDNKFTIISYERSTSSWMTDYNQNISSHIARHVWVDSSTGYVVAVGDGGTIIKKG
jgi:hypothetical protein